MIDLEKAIEILEKHKESSFDGYKNGMVSIGEIIEYLKIQVPTLPIVKRNSYDYKFYYCPRCKRKFEDCPRKYPKFCDDCGQAVKWE